MTDGYCSVSSMLKRDENLHHKSDSEGWLVSSWRWTSGQQTHVSGIHSGSTQDEELETASSDHFTPLFGQTV